MRRKVKTLFQGRIGMPDIQLKKIFESGEDLIIEHADKVMTIKNEDMRGRIVARSPEIFQDRFSKEKYKLCYYDWKPDPDIGDNQLTLL